MNTPTGRTKLRKQAEQFFYDNAGYSYDPKTQTAEEGHRETAKKLARAERNAASAGITFEWEIDPEGCIGCDCDSPDCACSTGEEHEVYWALARGLDGKVLASLGSICQPTREYRRVINAELAMEAL